LDLGIIDGLLCLHVHTIFHENQPSVIEVNNELGRMWMEAVGFILRYYPVIYLEELKKKIKAY
jgi:hypothetical protein